MNDEYPYARSSPSPQLTLDIFRGNWACRMPPELGEVTAGTAAAFQDPRMTWARDRFAEFGRPVEESSIVELGPLEGAHTYTLSRMGARSVTSIEAHKGAFLKCLIAKELLGVTNVNFLFGDGVAYLRENERLFDLGIASGFLYHMTNPVELIELLCKRCRAVYLWTVHWDPVFTAKNPHVVAGTTAAFQSEHAGFRHTLHRHDYGNAFEYGKFWGGPATHSHWMERDEILGALRHFGFTRQVVADEANPNGSALSVAATRA